MSVAGPEKYSENPKFLLTDSPQQDYIPAIPSLSEGRRPSLPTLGRDAVDAAASGAQVVAGRDQLRERPDGVLTNGAASYGKVVWT